MSHSPFELRTLANGSAQRENNLKHHIRYNTDHCDPIKNMGDRPEGLRKSTLLKAQHSSSTGLPEKLQEKKITAMQSNLSKKTVALTLLHHSSAISVCLNLPAMALTKGPGGAMCFFSACKLARDWSNQAIASAHSF